MRTVLLDDEGLVLLGDRRERQDLPVALLENIAPLPET
jgi:hypothetical protein